MEKYRGSLARILWLAAAFGLLVAETGIEAQQKKEDPKNKVKIGIFGGGGRHSLALRANGSVYAWGRNDSGQLGDDTTTDRLTPVAVKGEGGAGSLAKVTAVAAGTVHSLALTSDGKLWAWGNNFNGQLGDDTTTNRRTPVPVKGEGGAGRLEKVTAVAAGSIHNLVLTSDGKLWAWGRNIDGRLGDGTITDRNTPVPVKGEGGAGRLEKVTAVAAGWTHSLALTSDGKLWAWGGNTRGELGDGTTFIRRTPVPVKGEGGAGRLEKVIAVAASLTRSLALTSDGKLWAWGRNDAGQLGDDTTTDRSTPVAVKGEGGAGRLEKVIAIAAARDHSLALTSDGKLWAWGRNNVGQLGDNTTTDRRTPVAVKGEGGAGRLEKVIAIIAGASIQGGSDHSLALTSDGKFWAWGGNNVGQLGDGTTTNRTTPVRVSSLER